MFYNPEGKFSDIGEKIVSGTMSCQQHTGKTPYQSDAFTGLYVTNLDTQGDPEVYTSMVWTQLGESASRGGWWAGDNGMTKEGWCEHGEIRHSWSKEMNLDKKRWDLTINPLASATGSTNP